MPDAPVHYSPLSSGQEFLSSESSSVDWIDPSTDPSTDTPSDRSTDPSSGAPSAKQFERFSSTGLPVALPITQQISLWTTVMESLPLGIAIVDAQSGQTHWTNAALRALLGPAAGVSDVLRWQPHEYLPNLLPETWESVRQRMLAVGRATHRETHNDEHTPPTSSRCNQPPGSLPLDTTIVGSPHPLAPREAQQETGRLRFVHHATRNIAYWDWTVAPLPEAGAEIRYLLLTVENSTDGVMNERQLATAVRTAQQATRDKAQLYVEIAHQRAQLQSIFDHTPVGIVYFDANGLAVTANTAAAHKYGGTVDLLIGKPIETLLPELPKMVHTNAMNGKPFHASHVVSARPSQPEVVYDMSLVPVYADGEVTGILALTFEVTELVNARHEADIARREAEDALAAVRSTQSQMVQMEKMRAVGELAQGVAHDINNALMAVLGYSDLVMEELDDREALAHHVAMISKAAMDASSTVQRLNKFARRGVTTHGDVTDLNEVVRDVIQMTRPRWRDAAQKEGCAYQVETDLQPLPAILGEPSGLREVLINMIHNALNAMPKGGTLKLSTRPHGDQEVEIEVADSGTGMPPEVKSRIFDPFFTTRGVEGTGLGLAVSWSIIQRHGGTIQVESSPGVGTQFFIRLPINRQEGTVIPSPPLPLLPPPAPGIPVLVVEDEPIVGGVLSSILSRHGYRVTLTGDAETGLQKLNAPEADFQIVLTDHGMPGMNGLQLIAEIKRTHPDLKVLLLTGWGETVLETNVVEAMPDAVLGKPINQSDLLEAIARLLNHITEPTA